MNHAIVSTIERIQGNQITSGQVNGAVQRSNMRIVGYRGVASQNRGHQGPVGENPTLDPKSEHSIAISRQPQQIPNTRAQYRGGPE